MTQMCTLLPVAVNKARVMAVTRRVELLARKAIMDQKWGPALRVVNMG